MLLKALLSGTTLFRIPCTQLFSKRIPAISFGVLPKQFSKTSTEKVTIHFVTTSGERYTASAKVGDNLLDVVLDGDIDLDGFGACEGTLACSTCHLIFTKEQYSIIDNSPCEEELDMLDLAFGLTDYSRLGCQVLVKKEMLNWEILVPESTADARDV